MPLLPTLCVCENVDSESSNFAKNYGINNHFITEIPDSFSNKLPNFSAIHQFLEVSTVSLPHYISLLRPGLQKGFGLFTVFRCKQV